MQEQLYCVLDSKAQMYLPPFVSRNNPTAQRQFASAVADENHDFRRHAHDYSLWNIGTWDAEQAKITQETPVLVAQAHEILDAELNSATGIRAVQGGE